MQLANALWAARGAGTLVDVSAEVTREVGAGAYAVQAALTAAADATLIGWKIGATAEAAMQVLGLPEPFLGPLFDRYHQRSGSRVAVYAAHGPRVETEFVIGLARDLPPRGADYDRADIEAAVGWVAPGFEVVGTRFDTEFAGAGPLLIADGGANVAFIEGERTDDWRAVDLAAHEASLTVNGEAVATGNAGMSVWGHALGAVTWLANHAAVAPRGLRAGDSVMTGTCTGITPIAVGDSVSADFGTLGTLTAEFVAG